LDCYPIDGASKEKCESLGCIWSPVAEKVLTYGEVKPRVDEPWCYFPDNYQGYQLVDKIDCSSNEQCQPQDPSLRIKLKRVKRSALENDIENVFVDVYSLNAGSYYRIRVIDATRKRFEPELPRLSYVPEEHKSLNGELQVELTGNSKDGQPNSVLVIKRASTGTVLFSTDLSRLIFADKFIQLQSSLSSPYLFGLGEHLDNFTKTADKYKTYSMWNTDRLPSPDGTRSYGGFPFYINLEKNKEGKYDHAHGVYLHNSNAMDIVLQGDPAITFRPIGGVLDFFIFSGPSPIEVSSQFQGLVGFPDLPPRWALGFHLCRYQYGSLFKTKEVWARTREAGIPFDVQWNDIDYMESGNDFTVNKEKFSRLHEFVDDLHKKYHMRYIPIVDPGISQQPGYLGYVLGERFDIWIKNASGKPLVGKVWNKSGRTLWPDFSNPESREYWLLMLADFFHQVRFDGIWIDMNDISNFVDGSLDGCPTDLNSSDPVLREAAQWEHPPYKPGGYDLQSHSLCLSAKHYNGQVEYNMHNLYSSYEALATHQALEDLRPKKRTLVISRSTHPGQNQFSGHWSGDLLSDWNYLRYTIPSLLEHSMYGFSMMGSDICGFAGDTNPELCARWSTLGAFYTFSRNHNDDLSIDQDPVALGKVVVDANKFAFTKKYSLLPYFYTLLFRATIYGEPVARSLNFQFFNEHDPNLLQIEHQFMVGNGIMVSPIVHEATYSVRSYLPRGRWYETDILPESANKAPKLIDSVGEWTETSNVSLSNLVLFVRGGNIIPYYSKVAPTTYETALNQPISLEVAIGHDNSAQGSLVIDDGESAEMKFNQIEMFVYGARLLNLTMVIDSYQSSTPFGLVKVYGLARRISTVSIEKDKQEKLPFSQDGHMVTFDLGGLPLTRTASIIVEWK